MGLLSGSWDTDQRESWSPALGRTGTCKGGENKKEGEACGGSPDHDKTHQLPPKVTSRKCELANVTGGNAYDFFEKFCSSAFCQAVTFFIKRL